MARIMNQYGDYIVRLCYLYLKNWHLAEDASQEVFIKVYRYLEDFREDANEKTWISRIAINVCKNYRRTSWFRKVQIGLQTEDEANILEDKVYQKEKSIEEELVNRIESSELLKGVMSLPIKYREVILLHYYQELKISEIAEILHISEGAVKMRLSRGRNKMGNMLMEVKANGELA